MSLRVLLADDSPPLLLALQDVLDAAGHEVVAATTSGEEAVEAAQRHRPHVAVVDVEMPGGGAELVTRLLAVPSSPRVMVLSARDDVDTVLDMLAAGATGYVAKNGLDEDVEACIRRCASGNGLFVVAGCADRVRERLGALWATSSRPG